ncbi:MAG: hypothetical protein ACREV0_15420 [Burkholderiales bacterium]
MANVNQPFKQARRETSGKNIAVVLALIALAQFGTAFAGDADSARWNQESRLATPPGLPLEDENKPAIKRRFPNVWHPIQEPAKPPVRSEPVWAQDGYVFKYSF